MMAAMQTTPNGPPVVGYIIPYDEGLFQQLSPVADAQLPQLEVSQRFGI